MSPILDTIKQYSLTTSNKAADAVITEMKEKSGARNFHELLFKIGCQGSTKSCKVNSDPIFISINVQCLASFFLLSFK